MLPKKYGTDIKKLYLTVVLCTLLMFGIHLVKLSPKLMGMVSLLGDNSGVNNPLVKKLFSNGSILNTWPQFLQKRYKHVIKFYTYYFYQKTQMRKKDPKNVKKVERKQSLPKILIQCQVVIGLLKFMLSVRLWFRFIQDYFGGSIIHEKIWLKI